MTSLDLLLAVVLPALGVGRERVDLGHVRHERIAVGAPVLELVAGAARGGCHSSWRASWRSSRLRISCRSRGRGDRTEGAQLLGRALEAMARARSLTTGHRSCSPCTAGRWRPCARRCSAGGGRGCREAVDRVGLEVVQDLQKLEEELRALALALVKARAAEERVELALRLADALEVDVLVEDVDVEAPALRGLPCEPEVVLTVSSTSTSPSSSTSASVPTLERSSPPAPPPAAPAPAPPSSSGPSGRA